MKNISLILFLLYQLLFITLWSQSNYPVYVSPSLIPPYSLKLSDYGAFGSQRLMVTIVVNDLDVANLPVKLRVKMETAGVTFENPPTINTTPIFLDGGSATILFGEELADYFSISNLQFKGYSKEAYRVSGQLPEGFYRFTVEVLHFHTNRVISNAGTTTAWIALGKPPVLRMPANDVELGEYAGMPITFSWLSSSVGSPVSAGSIRYRFEMWEMRVKGVSPYNVVASMPLFHEYTTGSTFYSLNPASLMMEEGMSYAWRVTAYDESGFVPFEQDGHSQMRTFSYKSLCRGVTAIETSVAGQKGSFVWVPEGNHTSYNVEVRNNASGWFSAGETFNSKVEYYELERGQTYELRVQSVCNGNPGSTGDFSEWTALTIPDAKPQVSIEDCPGCGCDDDIPKVELTNFELRRNLSAGDTLSNKTGTTRFIVRSAEPQGDGIYKGLFYFWAEIWGAKILCEYWDLQVNSDNVIVNMDFRSINDPRFLVDVDAAIGAVAGLLDNAAQLTSDGTIKDTIQVTADFDNIIVRDGQLIAVTIDAAGNITETPLGISAEEAEQKLITNNKGDELVVTRKGEVMGAKEYQATGGGNSRLMKNYNKEKESNDLAGSGMVEFSAHPGQKYGFDAYTEQKQTILNNYPTLNNGYRPAFKSIESFQYDKVGVDKAGGLSFRDEMGVPSVNLGEGISLRGAEGGSIRSLYAYRDGGEKEEIVGKLNVMSFDNRPMRVYIVPVNGARLPSAWELQQTLNEVYRQAVTTWTVVEEPGITISFPDGKMTHGGSGDFDTYNADQKLIVETYTSAGRQLERESLYLFFVEGVTFKERSIAGFMPLQRQAGFIYDNPGPVTVAHELAHGAFNLRHTFSPQSFIVSEGQTQNLMDYTGGTELWQHQWDLIHNPERILFAWGQDEEEGEMIKNEVVKGYWKTVNPHLIYEARPKLTYSKIFIPDDEYIRNTHTLVELVDGSKFLASPLGTSEVGNAYQIKLPGESEWATVHLSWFESHCLSCELEFIGKELTKLAGTTIGRYVIPVEDGYILVTGENFDGEESSRIAAGGFILLEVVQVGKVFKLVKGAKIFTKTGKAVSTSSRVMKQFAKGVTEDVLIDMSCQLLINLVDESINHPTKSDQDILLYAFQNIDIKNAILGGIISYTSFDNVTKASFNCAKGYFTRMENGGEQLLLDIGKGTGDCLVEVGVSIAFSRIKGTEKMQNVIDAFSDAAKRDILLKRFKNITSESCFNYIESTVKQSIQKVY